MSPLRLLVCILLVLFTTLSASAQALPQARIAYQGYVELNGSPVNGNLALTFSLYKQAVGGTAVWSESYLGGNTVPVEEGVYSVALGSVAAFPAGTFDEQLWLGVRVGSAAELSPRTALRAAPYALGLSVPLDLAAGVASDALITLENTASGDGLRIEEVGRTGMVIRKAGDPNTVNLPSGNNGLVIGGAEDYGVYVGFAGDDGVRVGVANGAGVAVVSSAEDGVFVSSAGGPSQFRVPDPNDNGFEVAAAQGSGFLVRFADLNGVYVEETGDDGVDVVNAGNDGIRVREAGRYGALIQSTPSTDLGNLTTAYVGLFENKSSGASADGLAVKIGTTGNPTIAANFMGFFDGDGDLIGQIEGNGSGGVQYNTTGADYAEYLPVEGCATESCGLPAGTVVGIKRGTVSLDTRDADQVLVVSTRPAVVGNAPAGESTAGYAAIAMLGQAEVRVAGPVEAGDYVIASGLGDGVAKAVPARAVTVEMLERLIGRAWSAKTGAGVGLVNVAVGLDRTEVLAELLRAERARNDQQQREIDELRRLIESIAAR
ncbi:MAG: hypothetical protein AAF752_13145 [Bacteroidota bacterium]